MMKLSKLTALLPAVFLLFALCACGGQGGEEAAPPENPDASGEISAEESEDTVQVLALQKQLFEFYEQSDDALPVQSKASHVTLWNEDAARYPALSEALKQRAAMIRRSMEEEFDDLCASAKEELPWTADTAEPWVSTLDVQVRRADSRVVTLLSDSCADYGWIEDFRGMYGSSFDAETGEELMLEDVVAVNNDLAEAVAAELNRHLWAGDADFSDAVETYFAETPYADIRWTLDYNGVTFYFADGDLTEESGLQSATVTFAEHPGLFEEKYMTAPAAYTVELPMDSSYFTDLDGDGATEALNVTGWYDTDAGAYTKVGIYSHAGGAYQYEDCFAAGFIPYYVKTAEGKHYLYLFCRETESTGAIAEMQLTVFDVSGGNVVRVGEMHAAPGCVPTGIYIVPTDPEHFYLDDFDSMAQDMMPFAVGAAGLPERK